MFFNSIEFAVFLVIAFFIYWSCLSKRLKRQNLFVVIASYIFYGWWDWRFLFLILFSTLVDYSIGLGLSKRESPHFRKVLLLASLFVNLGLLGVFKYYDFFMENLVTAFSGLGITLHPSSLRIILPVGISFYTFQTLSYTIDVYRKRLDPTRDFIAFGAFVSFFPQLVAGPIERATHLLPQFLKEREFNYGLAVDGLRQILWGLFKKVVIADRCAVHANLIFNHSGEYSGSTLVLGVFFFAFQIYGDFSGYSDIAIGTARLFGFDLMQNFAFPYFSRDIAEFWRRWHISLSTWFRDYLYIPLGGSRGSMLMKVRNVFLVFIISGFWHGANWTFIIWGLLNAIYFLPLMLCGGNRLNVGVVAEGRLLPSVKEILQISGTFILTCIAWVFFRAESANHAGQYFAGIFSFSLFSIPDLPLKPLFRSLILLLVFIFVEWVGRDRKYAVEGVKDVNSGIVRWLIYTVIIYSIGMYMELGGADFLYFQF